ncbi:MFS transporter [Marinospirillum alkaliphilum]|uniref:Predicted arabinose efflux permease, MFS family n=1 Tax=Marinospirillum alkaliphilum DSM 21637 TaxID=1122209 RepID=A0A1K1TSX8_9GAMM|nr:MFS transporter [Marinospirillum alkaliphilum]SFX03815.1 Predicted arabinose efflux permease, MFS family [Marinospirillum alkaliphilum DSM 21637]
MKVHIPAKSRPTVLASLVLTLTLVSDAVLYLLLPLYFESFGLTLIWVGILLAANRLIRLAINPWVMHYFLLLGPRHSVIIAVTLATLASLAFVFIHQIWILLLARCLWGAAYALMRQACLHYATEHPQQRMQNLGWFTTLQEVGPLLVLLAAPWLTGLFSTQAVLLLASGLCLVAFIPALALPPSQSGNNQAAFRFTLPWPGAWQQLTLLVCLLFDGLWLVMLAPQLRQLGWGLPEALALASLLMVGKRLFNLLLGIISVRFSLFQQEDPWLYAALLLLLPAGLLLPGPGILIGSLLAILGHGLFMLLLPRKLADLTPDTTERQQQLNSFTFWRDVAAALGALLAGLLLQYQLLQVFFILMTLLTGWQVFRVYRLDQRHSNDSP